MDCPRDKNPIRQTNLKLLANKFGWEKKTLRTTGDVNSDCIKDVKRKSRTKRAR